MPQQEIIQHAVNRELIHSLEYTYSFWKQRSEEFLEQEYNTNTEKDFTSILTALDMLLLLCFKWKRSKYIYNDDKKIIKELHPKIRELYEAIENKMGQETLQPTSRGSIITKEDIPVTSNEELAKETGLPYVPKDEWEAAINFEEQPDLYRKAAELPDDYEVPSLTILYKQAASVPITLADAPRRKAK